MSQRKLLLADDSITIQKVVNLTFADEGIEVITVGDGDSAMEKMADIAPDLVMADVNMPGLNGYELCEKIRQSDNLKQTPVILLVGSFEPFDEEKAKSVGANDFLTKPFQSIRQLVSKVTDLLDSPQNGEVETASTDFENAKTLSDFSVSSDSTESTTPQNFQPYGDAGMDDEMIQTDRGESFSMDESPKFESRVVSEPEYEGKTQPLTAEDIREFPFTPTTEETQESSSSFETTQEISAEQYSAQIESDSPETETPPVAELFDFSDDNLLEIPFEEYEEEDLAQEESVSETPTEQVPETQTIAEETQTEVPSAETEETVSAYQQVEPEPIQAEPEMIQSESEPSQTESDAVSTATQLSPEMIEAIAQKVVEKLSDKAVKDVAWEVVPQMADLIIKKMAEEKLKE